MTDTTAASQHNQHDMRPPSAFEDVRDVAVSPSDTSASKYGCFSVLFSHWLDSPSNYDGTLQTSMETLYDNYMSFDLFSFYVSFLNHNSNQ